MIRSLSALVLGALVLSGCATPQAQPGTMTQAQAGWGSGLDSGAVNARTWRAIITPDDLDRLELVDQAWSRALDQARRLGGSGDFAGLGALTDPRAALSDPAPPPGDYACRTVKIGQQGEEASLGYVVYGWFTCRIEQTPQGLRLVKLTGSQRPSGLLFPEDGQGMVFLGSVSMDREPRATSYGLDDARDFAGRFERIGPQRWRLVVPFPEYESILDVIELVPAA